jgi:predicted enzyme related to lactoylglutathione lyase
VQVAYLFAGLPVRDFESARSWYEQLFDAPPDRLPKPGKAVWQVASTSLVYVVTDEARAGSGLLTLAIDDLDGHVAALNERGIYPRIGTLANGIRKALVTDPDGNEIGFFEAPPS